MKADLPEILQDLKQFVATQLRDSGIPKSQAEEVATRTAQFMQRHWSGATIYIPQGRDFEAAQRAERVMADIRCGMTTRQAALKHGLSNSRVSQIRQEYQTNQTVSKTA